MANRDRRSVAQPLSYKMFNEVGNIEEPTALLPLQTQSDANGGVTDMVPSQIAHLHNWPT